MLFLFLLVDLVVLLQAILSMQFEGSGRPFRGIPTSGSSGPIGITPNSTTGASTGDAPAGGKPPGSGTAPRYGFTGNGGLKKKKNDDSS